MCDEDSSSLQNIPQSVPRREPKIILQRAEYIFPALKDSLVSVFEPFTEAFKLAGSGTWLRGRKLPFSIFLETSSAPRPAQGCRPMCCQHGSVKGRREGETVWRAFLEGFLLWLGDSCLVVATVYMGGLQLTDREGSRLLQGFFFFFFFCWAVFEFCCFLLFPFFLCCSWAVTEVCRFP
jgi:hypothetical protein